MLEKLRLRRHMRTKSSSIARFLSLIWLIILSLLVFQQPRWTSSAVVPAKIAESAWNSAQNGLAVDVIVLLEQQADLQDASLLSTKQAKQTFVYDMLYQTAEANQVDIRDWLTKKGIAHRSFYIVNALQLEADADLMAALAKRNDVKRVITNPQIALAPDLLLPSTNDGSLHTVDGIEWGIEKIQAPQVWELGYRGAGVVVAGQDTGYDWDHPALQASYRGWNGTTVNHDYAWHDAIHSGGGGCGTDSPFPCDDYGHGTHTMGTIVGNTETVHIGVAPDARWIGCRNMSVGYGTPASYAECFEFFMAPYPVTGTPAQGIPAMAPDVVNNSWGCPPSEGCDFEHITFLNQVVDNVRATGIMVVSSAGNHGSACGTVNEPPAMYDATYTVGASDTLDSIAAFSSRGTGTGLIKPDIVAPGVGVLSSVPGTGYGLSQGTSMASPHVVGAIALLWSASPGLRGQIQVTENILNQSAVLRYSTQCGDAPLAVPNNIYGWGRVDAFAAVQSLGILSGNILDQNSAGISGAVIRAEIQPEIAWETSADAQGFYTLHPVSGTYTVTVSKPAYLTQVFTDVVVTATQTTTLAVTLTQQCVPLMNVSFMSLPQFPQTDRPALFTGSVVTGSAPITFTWNFGDGTPIQAGNPISHGFVVPSPDYAQTYQGVLTATNACSSDDTRQWITVHTVFSFLPNVLRGP